MPSVVKASMASLIDRVRLLINDPRGATQIFGDSDVQDVLDEGREDIVNMSLIGKPTFSGSTILYLNYYSEYGGWESDYVLKQYLTVTVTPASAEEIAGHFVFAASTLPPIFITGKLFDIYRAAADLLERTAAKWQGVMGYDFASDGQSFKRSQAPENLQKLADKYRMKQRARSISVFRSDTNAEGESMKVGLGAKPLDYFASGNGS
jgi:hypothetical protein